MRPSPARVASRHLAAELPWDRFFAAIEEMRRRIDSANDFRILDLEVENVQRYVTGGSRAGYLPKGFPRTYNRMLQGAGVAAIGEGGLDATKKTYQDILDAMEKAARRIQKRLSKRGSAAALDVEYEVDGHESSTPTVTLWVDGEDVGFVELRMLKDPEREVTPACRDDWEKLHREIMSRGADGVWTYRVHESGLREDVRGLGFGKGMYEALMEELGEYTEPVIFVADKCAGGVTSRMALRVWASLSKRWLSSGLAVSSLRR